MKIADITIGERHRKEMGDLAGLARSMSEVGLLHPVVVSTGGVLIVGERRVRAAQMLGWDDIPARVLDLQDMVRGEHDENAIRKDFTPSEKVSITEALEPIERAAARERQLAGVPSVKFTEGEAKAKVAAAVGWSRPTYEKAKAVIAAAEEEPERYGGLVETMDRTGKVDRAYKELKRERTREHNRVLVESAPQIAEVGAVYKTIVLDPPWDWGDEGDCDQYGRARPVYTTMPIDEIAALPVSDLAEPNAHIYLWITNRSLPKGFALLDGWGFRYVTMLTWCKPHFGMGNYFRGSTEHVLFGVRGSLPLLRSDVGTWFDAPRPGQHSAKPDAFYDLVETCSPGPWLEMFARRARPGWQTWGAEV